MIWNFETILLCVVCFFGLYSSLFFLFLILENREKIEDPEPKRFPSVTIIVPAYNEEKTVGKTIRSLLKLDYPKNKLKIFVVDDGSTDKTYAIAKKFEKENKGLVKVFTKPNGGKASALNYGIRRTKSEIIVSMDADSFVSRDALKRMVGYFEDPRVMAVTPSLKVYKPKGFWRRIQAMEYLLGVFLRKAFALLGSIHVTPGPFSAYRREFFEKHGYYDEGNLTEDIEVALRIQAKGYDIENSIKAEVFTVAPRRFLPLLKQRLRWYTGFMVNLFRYKRLFKQKNNLGLFVLPTSLISIGLVLVTMGYSFYLLVKGAQDLIRSIKLIGLVDLIKTIKFNFSPFYLGNEFVLVTASCFVLGFLIIYSAKLFSREKSKIKYSYLLYVLVYYYLFGFWWFWTLINRLFGKHIKW